MKSGYLFKFYFVFIHLNIFLFALEKMTITLFAITEISDHCAYHFDLCSCLKKKNITSIFINNDFILKLQFSPYSSS